MTKKSSPAPKLVIKNELEVVTFSNGRKLASRKLGTITLQLAYSMQRYDMEDKSQTCNNEDSWYLFIGGVNEGSFTARTHHKTNNWSISSSRIDTHRGIGLGQWIYAALAEYYGILESDPYGTTSADATRVWKKLGAQVISGDGGGKPRYRLMSKKLKEKAKVAKAKLKAKKKVKK